MVRSKRLNRILKNSPQAHNDFLLVSLTVSAFTEMQFHANVIQRSFHIQIMPILHLLEEFAENRNLFLSVTLSLSLLLSHLFFRIVSLTKKFTLAVLLCKLTHALFAGHQRSLTSSQLLNK